MKGENSLIEPSSKQLEKSSNINPGLDVFPSPETQLMKNVNAAGTVEELFEVIRNNVVNMSGQECVLVLNALFDILQYENASVVDDIRATEEVNVLFKALKRQIRMVPLTDIITALKVAVYLNVPISSIMCQSLLYMISKMSNELTTEQIIFIDVLLKNTEPCPIVDALKIAMPVIFNSQVMIRLDCRSCSTLVNLLHYGSNNKMEEQIFDAILKNLLRFQGELRVQQCLLILHSLLTRNYLNDLRINMYNSCLNRCRGTLQNVSFDQIISIVNRMVSQSLNCDYVFYDEPFLNNVVSYVLKKKLSFDLCAQLLKLLIQLGFVNFELLNYMDSQLLQYDNFSEIQSPELLATFLSGLAMAFYRPKHWYLYKDRLVGLLQQNKDRINYPTVSIAYDLICLDYWDDKLLEYIFSEEYVALKAADDQVKKQISEVYRVTRILHPKGYKGPSLPSSFIADEFEGHNENSLLPFLQHFLGGSEYVLSSVFTKFGHFLDHVVVVNNNQPVLINPSSSTSVTSNTNISDLNVSEGSDLIAIVIFDDSHVCINANKLKGHTAVYLCSMKLLGVKVIPILLNEWNEVPEYEKVSILQKALGINNPVDVNTENKETA